MLSLGSANPYQCHINKEKTRLVITDNEKHEITSIAIRVIGSSYLDKMIELFLTLFSWKWTKIDKLDEEAKEHIIVNVNSLSKRLLLDKKLIYHLNAVNRLIGEFPNKIYEVHQKVLKEIALKEFITEIKQMPVRNQTIIERLNFLWGYPHHNEVRGSVFRDVYKEHVHVTVEEENLKNVVIYYAPENNQFSIGLNIHADSPDYKAKQFHGEKVRYQGTGQIYQEGGAYYFKLNEIILLDWQPFENFSEEDRERLKEQVYQLMQ